MPKKRTIPKSAPPVPVRKAPIPAMSQTPQKPWPRPVLGIPLERAISHADKVFYDFLAIVQQGFPVIAASYGRTDVVRNKFALHTLSADVTHLVMLDLDHKHPWDIVQRFMNWFIQDPSLRVIGGLNFRRGEPYDPCAYIKGDSGKYHPIAAWEPGLNKVDIVGTGAIAIDRRVFEQIEPPWFAFDYSRVLDDNWPGEDFWFCQRCTEAGIDIFVDTTLTSPHLIDAVVDANTFREYQAEHNMGVISIDQVVSPKKEQTDEPDA